MKTMMKIFNCFLITVLTVMIFPFFLIGVLLLLVKALGYLLLFERVYAAREIPETASYLRDYSELKEE